MGTWVFLSIPFRYPKLRRWSHEDGSYRQQRVEAARAFLSSQPFLVGNGGVGNDDKASDEQEGKVERGRMRDRLSGAPKNKHMRGVGVGERELVSYLASSPPGGGDGETGGNEM